MEKAINIKILKKSLICLIVFIVLLLGGLRFFQQHRLKKQFMDVINRRTVYLSNGNSFLQEGDYYSAMAAFSNALSVSPDWDIAEHNLLVAQRRKNRYEKSGIFTNEGESICIITNEKFARFDRSGFLRLVADFRKVNDLWPTNLVQLVSFYSSTSRLDQRLIDAQFREISENKVEVEWTWEKSWNAVGTITETASVEIVNSQQERD